MKKNKKAIEAIEYKIKLHRGFIMHNDEMIKTSEENLKKHIEQKKENERRIIELKESRNKLN